MAFMEKAICESVGGVWLEGIIFGTIDKGFRCYLGEGVLFVLNFGCDDDGLCDGKGI